MSPNQIQRRMKAVRLADAINNIEGVPVSQKARELSNLWAQGNITALEMKKQLIEAHRKA